MKKPKPTRKKKHKPERSWIIIDLQKILTGEDLAAFFKKIWRHRLKIAATIVAAIAYLASHHIA